MKAKEIEKYIPTTLPGVVTLTEKEADLVKAINLALRPLIPLRGGKVRRVFLPADRGTPADYPRTCHYVSDEVSAFKEKFPDKEAWYMLDVFSSGDVCALVFASFLYLYTGETISEGAEDGGRVSLLPLLEWMLSSCALIRKMMQDGTYTDYLESNFPRHLIPGVIRSAELWKFLPEEKEKLFSSLTEEEVDYFMISSTDEEIRSGKSYDADSLAILASECSALLGGVPFKAVGEVSYVIDKHIYIKSKKDNDGSYIELGYKDYAATADTVKCFSALHSKGIAIMVPGAKTIRERLNGDDFTAIVPDEYSEYQLFFRKIDITGVDHFVPYPKLDEKSEEAFRAIASWEGVPDYSREP